MKIAFIPDIQAKPGVRLDHCTWIARYLAKKRPDVTVLAGDLFDFPSQCFYERGKRTMEGRRLLGDFVAGVTALTKLSAGLEGRKVFLEGNHEERVRRLAQENPSLEGSLPDVRTAVEALGWEFHRYLRPVRIGGVAFCHNFPKAGTGRVTASAVKYGPPSADAMVKANMESCVMGHRQGLELSKVYYVGNRTVRGIIAGSCYLHDEPYLGEEQKYWRGILLLHEVNRGSFNVLEVSLDYLQREYGGKGRN